MMTPSQQWNIFRARPDNDMYEYSPYLREIAKGNVLEIGVCQGVSTSAFLLGLDDKQDGHLWSIDIDPKCEIFQHPRWTFTAGDSRTVQVPDVQFDVLFIDGDHHYDGVLSDLTRFSPLVKPGGLILMHDVDPDPKNFDLETNRWTDGRPEEHQYPPYDPSYAMLDFCTDNEFTATVMPGKYGLGVMVKGE